MNLQIFHNRIYIYITGLAAGSLVEKPEDPECEGYVFNGWFKDRKCTDDWNFETDTVKTVNCASPSRRYSLTAPASPPSKF